VQVMARMLAPFVAFFMLYLTDLGTPLQRLFNFYTIPMWLAVLLGVGVLVFLAVAFEEPPRRVARGGQSIWTFDRHKAPHLVRHMVITTGAQFVTTIGLFCIYSQLFGFAAGQYHIGSETLDLYLIYMGLGPGFLIAMIIWSNMKKSSRFQDYDFILMALVAFVVANIVLIRFVHEPPIPLFFLGTGLIGMGLLWYALIVAFMCTAQLSVLTQYTNTGTIRTWSRL
jgi:hypothetical protein